MSQSEQIIFTVMAMKRPGVWEPQGQAEEMHAAVTAAKGLAKSGRFKGVKVDQTFQDKINGRQVNSTIYQHGVGSPGSSLMLWLGLACLAGVVSFGVTYGLTL